MPPLLIGFFIFSFLYFLSAHLKLRLKLSSIPGPPGTPLLGNSLQLIRGGSEALLGTLQSYREQYGPRYQMWLGVTPYVVLTSASDMEVFRKVIPQSSRSCAYVFQKVLSSQAHIEKSEDYVFLLPWLGEGLLTSSGALWHSRRKLLTPAFHFSILEDFLQLMNEQSEVLVGVLRAKVEEAAPFDIFPIITRAALDIICETAMGEKIHAQMDAESDYVKAVYRITELILHRQLRPWLHPHRIWSCSPSGREEKRTLSILHNFTDSVIQKRKEERGSKGNRPNTKKPAFLDLLLDYQSSTPSPPLTDLSIREEVDTFMFEGHDTTAANINWTLYLIALNPLVQGRVHEELDSVLGSERTITSGHLAKLKYLEMCIKESLRLYPSVPFIARRLGGEVELEDGTRLPPEAVAFLLIQQLHRDPQVFPNPEEFKPERFENSEGSGETVRRNPFGYVPFSAGPRNCIGQKFALMEEKVVLGRIFQEYRAVALEKRENVHMCAELILRPKEGIWVTLEKR